MPEEKNETLELISSAFEGLEKLGELGKKEKEVKAGNVKLTIGTLDSEEEVEVFSACSNLSGNSYFYKLKKETLKYCIKAVDGKRLDDYKKVDDQKEREKLRDEVLEKKSAIIKTWDDTVI